MNETCPKCGQLPLAVTHPHLSAPNTAQESPASAALRDRTAGSVDATLRAFQDAAPHLTLALGDLLNELQAEAWDAGFTYGRQMLGAPGAKDDNPHRGGDW